MQVERKKIQGSLIADYVLKAPERPSGLLVLLHGYQRTGSQIFRHLEPALPKDWAVLSPNGPYPLPERHGEGYRVGYSWYFYDPKSDEYFIDMEIASEYLRSLIRELGYQASPKKLIGFSQGGYLAPVAAQELKGVRQVVGLASAFLSDEIAGSISFRMDAIHGDQDKVVKAEDSRAQIEKLRARGVEAYYHPLARSGHAIDEPMREVLARVLAEGG